jgi:hypothetical protein
VGRIYAEVQDRPLYLLRESSPERDYRISGNAVQDMAPVERVERRTS